MKVRENLASVSVIFFERWGGGMGLEEVNFFLLRIKKEKNLIFFSGGVGGGGGGRGRGGYSK